MARTDLRALFDAIPESGGGGTIARQAGARGTRTASPARVFTAWVKVCARADG